MNLDARRDWGFAGDYVDAMWRMLQKSKPDEYVVATGATKSVREFVDAAFATVDLDTEAHVRIRADLIRPAEVDLLVGDPSKAKQILGWTPQIDFHGLVEMMVRADYDDLLAQDRKALPAQSSVARRQVARNLKLVKAKA